MKQEAIEFIYFTGKPVTIAVAHITCFTPATNNSGTLISLTDSFVEVREPYEKVVSMYQSAIKSEG